MSLKSEFMAEVFHDSLARADKAAQDKINAALARAEKAEADLVQHRTWHNENMIQIARDGETIKKLESELAKARKLLAWCHRCNVLMNLVYPEDGSYRCPRCATRATPVPIREACEFEEEIETLKSQCLRWKLLPSGQSDDTVLRGSVEITIYRAPWEVLAVTSRSYGGFSGVGGKVEPGETFEQAARRELREETGLEAVTMQFIAGHALDPLPNDKFLGKWYCAGFVATVADDATPQCVETGTTPFWTTPDEFVAHSLFPEWYGWWFRLLERLGYGGVK